MLPRLSLQKRAYVSDPDKYSRCSTSLDEDPVDIASNASLGTTRRTYNCRMVWWR